MWWWNGGSGEGEMTVTQCAWVFRNVLHVLTPEPMLFP